MVNAHVRLLGLERETPGTFEGLNGEVLIEQLGQYGLLQPITPRQIDLLFYPELCLTILIANMHPRLPPRQERRTDILSI